MFYSNVTFEASLAAICGSAGAPTATELRTCFHALA